MSAKPALNGRELFDEELERIRAEIERFDTICVIDDEMRALIASQWPPRSRARLCRPGRR